MAAGNTYTPIATTTLASASANYTFSSISGSYTDLVLVINGAASISNGGVYLRFNGDTATNYSETNLRGNGTTAASDRDSSVSYLPVDGGVAFGTTAGASTLIVQIMNYSNSTTYKTALCRKGQADTGSYQGTAATVGLWRSTAAITTILVYCSGVMTLSAGTTLTLYGILAA